MGLAESADMGVVEPQAPNVVRVTLGRSKWLGYVTAVLSVAVALGIIMSATGGLSLVLGSIYFACVAWVALDFLYLDAFEIEANQDKGHARSLLRSYDFDLRSVTRVRRSAWPMLFGMRIVVFGAGTGVRISEAIGLTLDKVDFLRRTATIDRQLAGIVDGAPNFGPVKDRKNRPRVIPLPDVVLSSLSEHLLQWPAQSDGLVFTSDQNGPIRRTTFSDVWRRSVEPLGVPKGDGYHQLRHFYASLLIGHGESVKVVQERLGHSSALMTLDTYAHLWPDSEDSTRAAVDMVLGNPAVSDSCPTQGE
jgi:hypothetical protein